MARAALEADLTKSTEDVLKELSRQKAIKP
jgi:hypothetical protein